MSSMLHVVAENSLGINSVLTTSSISSFVSRTGLMPFVVTDSSTGSPTIHSVFVEPLSAMIIMSYI